MAIKNRFYKTTQGVPFEFIVGTTLTDYSTLPAMVAAAPAAGTIAAFIEDFIAAAPASTPWNAAIATGYQKKNYFNSVVEYVLNGKAAITSTTPMRTSTIFAELKAYAAPTFQKTSITLTSGSISANQLLSFKIIETTPGNEPLPSWDYTQVTNNPDVPTAWGNIATKINLGLEDEFFTAAVNALVSPTFGTVGTTTNTVTSVPISAGGSGIFTAAIPNGNGSIPIVFTGGGGTGAAANLNIVNGIATSVTITNAGSGYTTAPTASIAAQTGLTGLTVTSTDSTRHFRMVASMLPTRADFTDTNAAFTATTSVKAFAGSGTLAQVQELQAESFIRRGVTTNYPMNGVPSEYGTPIDIASLGTTFDIVVLTGTKSEDSPTPVETHHRKHWVFIAVPAGQGSKITAQFP